MNDVPVCLKTEYFFDFARFQHRELFEGAQFAWDVIRRLQAGIAVDKIARAFASTVGQDGINKSPVIGDVRIRVAQTCQVGPFVAFYGDREGAISIDEGARILPGTVFEAGKNAIYVGKNAIVGPNAHINATRGSIYIGPKTHLRQSAFIREHVIIEEGTCIGNSCEIKCAFIGPYSEVPHFNYVGDSVFGWKAHTGAGVKISNVKVTPGAPETGTVTVRFEGKVFDTGLRKFGAILGDQAQVGCNSVTNPGTMIGRNSLVYAGCSISGFVKSDTIVKLRQTFEQVALKH